jgi:hypothetical protein
MSDRDENDDFDMREPQWGRALGTHSRADQRDGSNLTEHGDAIRWGAAAEVLIPATNQIIYSEQLIKVERETPYPANFQMVGTLTVPADWAASLTPALEWAAYLELIMGVGQTRLTHIVNLRALMDLAVVPALLPTGQSYYLPNPAGSGFAFPWILPGGILAKSLQMRAFFVAAAGESTVSTPATLSITAAVSPYNAGDSA